MTAALYTNCEWKVGKKKVSESSFTPFSLFSSASLPFTIQKLSSCDIVFHDLKRFLAE